MSVKFLKNNHQNSKALQNYFTLLYFALFIYFPLQKVYYNWSGSNKSYLLKKKKKKRTFA